jgi:HPt (histidine-containing phosphotransfer) domain-containing protein
MSTVSAIPDFLLSELAGDPGMAEIVETFVFGLSARAEAIERACSAQDVDSLRTLVHQLKGAAGSYGFPAITEAARTLEQATKSESSPETLRALSKALIALCRCARVAAPGGQTE